MRKSILLALPLLLAVPLVAVPLIAQGGPPALAPGAKDLKRVTAGSYTADAGHTLIGWRVDHFGFNDYLGLFGDVTGTLDIDPKAPNNAKVSVTIPVSKVTTASAGLTSHLLRPGKDGGKPDFFGANPADAKFVSTKVVAKGMNATITGDLTLNGVTKPVTLNAKFSGAGNNPYSKKATVGFHATGAIKRSEFGMGYGIPNIGDTVMLDISVAFEKAG
jgi:polyisoprenoid-binding protein YceI